MYHGCTRITYFGEGMKCITVWNCSLSVCIFLPDHRWRASCLMTFAWMSRGPLRAHSCGEYVHPFITAFSSPSPNSSPLLSRFSLLFAYYTGVIGQRATQIRHLYLLSRFTLSPFEDASRTGGSHKCTDQCIEGSRRPYRHRCGLGRGDDCTTSFGGAK
jgi:hypothetical protein